MYPRPPSPCAGSDRCIRYVYPREVSRSYVVCGPLSSGAAGPHVRYSLRMEGSCGVISEEIAPPRPAPAGKSGGGSVAEERAQRRLLAQAHRDCVTALAMVALPNGPVLVSASRDGVVKAWR